MGRGEKFLLSENFLADRLMSVSGEILMFLFRRKRVKHLEIGDAQRGGRQMVLRH